MAAARAILTYLLRKIQYFYMVLVYGASTPALIYPLASPIYEFNASSEMVFPIFDGPVGSVLYATSHHVFRQPWQRAALAHSIACGPMAPQVRAHSRHPHTMGDDACARFRAIPSVARAVVHPPQTTYLSFFDFASADALSLVFVGLGHCHCRQHATTRWTC